MFVTLDDGIRMVAMHALLNSNPDTITIGMNVSELFQRAEDTEVRIQFLLRGLRPCSDGSHSSDALTGGYWDIQNLGSLD